MRILKLLLSPIIISISTHGSGQILKKSELPIIIIHTQDDEIPDEPKIDARMGIIYNGEGKINAINDNFNHYSGFIGIETRGNSTQDFDKKTYSIELRNANNADLSVPLLGMDSEEDWILHAMVIDKSLLRIPYTFYLWQQMGHYGSNWRFVELIIDGDYRGLYLLTERIKQGPNRVDIKPLESNDLSGDNITGGYILRIDWLDDALGFESNYQSMGGNQMLFQWYYPRADRLKTEQMIYIQNWTADFESALFAKPCSQDSKRAYTEYIDMNSFVDFMLINEFSKNADGYKLSSYVHKQADSEGGKLVAGPIWDFDQTYGLSTVCSCHDPTGWTFLQNQDGCEDLESMPLWWSTLVKDSVFRNALIRRWNHLRATVLDLDSIYNWIDTYEDQILEARQRNYTRWPNVIGESIWIEPEPIPQTYEAEINQLKTWIEKRIVWIDSNIQQISTENRVEIGINPNPSKGIFTIETQEVIKAKVYNIEGQLIVETDKKKIDLSEYSNGFYIIRIEIDGALVCAQKVLKG
ncbi:MAG: CotH kinase family protein [Bacteroidia bacterium]